MRRNPRKHLLTQLILAAVVVSTSTFQLFPQKAFASEQLDITNTYSSQPIPPGFHGARYYTFGQISPVGAASGSYQETADAITSNTVFVPCSELSSIQLSHKTCIESLAYRRIGESNWSLGEVTDWKPSPTDNVISDSSSSSTFTNRSLPIFAQELHDGFPIGGLVRVWRMEGALHAGGTDYLLGVGYSKTVNRREQMTYRGFNVSLVPVALGARNTKGGQWPLGYGSAFEFNSTHEFRVQIKMGKFLNEIGGWSQGRILNPKLSLQDDTLTISGRPSKSLIAVAGPFSCEDWVEKTPTTSDLCKSRSPSPIFNRIGGMHFMNSYENASRATNFYPEGAFEYWKDKVRPEGYSHSWSMVSLGITRTGNCEIPPGKIGIVSSDAMLYSTSPPTWNAQDQSLSYQVASTPTGPSGETIIGNFYIAIPKTFATCLWGVDASNAVAQISVTSSDGSPRVVTSSLNRDNENIYFNASGFTFSSPTIKVKLTQAAQAPAKDPAPTAPSESVEMKKETKKEKKRTICVKGKQRIKVIDAKSKCPAGYKRA